MPLIDDLIDKLGEAKLLSKMHLNKEFYQIPLKEADMSKAAFCTPWGKFQFTRMPIGLRNAPATFQRLMHVVLAGLESFCNAYIDDIIIFSDSWEEHLEHIRLVVEKLRQAGLTAKPSKCCWGIASLTYLGHVVGKEKESAVPECKAKSIREFVKHDTKKDLQSFLVLLGTTGNSYETIPRELIASRKPLRRPLPRKFCGVMICMMHFYTYAVLYPTVVCCIFLFPAIHFFCKPMLQEEELALLSASSEMEKSYL